MPKITVRLNPKSIDQAIKRVEVYKRELRSKLNSVIEQLTAMGVEIAKVQVRQLGAVYTGELEESIEGMFNPATGIGIIRAGADYAVYVEYGTGVVGQGSPHPEPKGWKYDVNSHGESGWWYYNPKDGTHHWTKGMVSRPFMYNTRLELEREAERVVKEVFAR